MACKGEPPREIMDTWPSVQWGKPAEPTSPLDTSLLTTWIERTIALSFGAAETNVEVELRFYIERTDPGLPFLPTEAFLVSNYSSI